LNRTLGHHQAGQAAPETKTQARLLLLVLLAETLSVIESCLRWQLDLTSLLLLAFALQLA